MRVAIAGAGGVGRSIARELVDNGHKVGEMEAATGARVAFITRFGKGVLPISSTVLQDGDQVHVLVTDDIADAVEQVTSSAPRAVEH